MIAVSENNSSLIYLDLRKNHDKVTFLKKMRRFFQFKIGKNSETMTGKCVRKYAQNVLWDTSVSISEEENPRI